MKHEKLTKIEKQERDLKLRLRKLGKKERDEKIKSITKKAKAYGLNLTREQAEIIEDNIQVSPEYRKFRQVMDKIEENESIEKELIHQISKAEQDVAETERLLSILRNEKPH